MKKIYLIATLILSLSSCTVYRTFRFNADHSGTVENKIDMTEMIKAMGDYGSSGMGNMSDMAQLDQSKAKLEAISGISNVKVVYDTTGIMYSSYDFSTIDALINANASGGNMTNMMMGMNEGGAPTKPKITFKGKKFFMEEVDKKSLQKMQSEEAKKEMAQMDMIMASSQINTTLIFPTSVKKVSYKNASVTNDNTVNYVIPLKDYLSKDYKPLTINLK